MKYLSPVMASGLAGFLVLVGATSMVPAATATASDTAGRINMFGVELYAQAEKANADKNLFLSPYSVASALAMTAQGARDRTADQMNAVLHTGAGQPVRPANSNIQAGMSEMAQALAAQPNSPFELSIANALWVDQAFPLAAGFVEDSRKEFRADVIGVDFVRRAEAVRLQINSAIAAQTHDKIKDLIGPGAVDASTALVLTNAIYFKGAWQEPFPKAATTDQPFHAPGKDVDVPMMRSPNSAFFQYAETDDAQIVSLPYKDGAVGRGARGGVAPATLSMLVILPKKANGLTGIEKQATVANLSQWTSNLRRQAVRVFLPRFTMTSQFEFSKELKALGMTDAFSPAADFSGVSASAAGKLYIGAVVHKAFVDVNEEGTEAAGATGVIMMRSAAMPGNPVEFRADHPFLFLIRHEPSGAILFMGRVVNPKG